MSVANPTAHNKAKLANTLFVSPSLLQRVLQLEQSINSIGSKIDAVVRKLDVLERNNLKRKDLLGKPLDNVSKVGSPPQSIQTSSRAGDQPCCVKRPGTILAFPIRIDIRENGLGKVSILYNQAFSVQAK